MRSLTLARNTAGALAFVLIAGALVAAPAPAAGGGAAPWFSQGRSRPVTPGMMPPLLARKSRREAPFIRHLYRGFLDRDPSGDEVRSWQSVLGEEAGATEVIRSFMESDEFFVRQVYLGLLRREPDPSGMETHTRALRGGMSREDLVESILASEEFGRVMR